MPEKRGSSAVADVLVESHNLAKIYRSHDLEGVALQGLDAPRAGRCEVAGVDLTRLTRRERLLYRRRIVGPVWQQTSRNLLSDLTLLDNVMTPMLLAGYPARKQRARATELLWLVGLGDRLDHKPERLSGGEQQRGALAVALANEPPLLLADEPTGELDSATATEALNLLRRLNVELGLTTIVVTHDTHVAEAMDRSVMAAPAPRWCMPRWRRRLSSSTEWAACRFLD